MTVRGNVTKFS